MENLGKRGQFYLVAAIVLAAVIIGVSAVANYAERGKNDELYNLRDEIRIEAEKTVDYGTKNGFNRFQMNTLLENFTEHYVNYEATKGKDIYFLFGDVDNLTLSGFQEGDKTVSLSSGVLEEEVTNSNGRFSRSINPTTEEVTVSIDGTDYDFVLRNGENFYFIVTQEISGGRYVIME